MNNFKSGDKVIMKDYVTGEKIQEFGIDGNEINEMKGKILIVSEAWTDRDGIDVVDFKDTGYIWKPEWFRYYSNIPEELFEIKE